MSVSELQLAKNEKFNELGFLYYNKAVDGMEMSSAALEIINDIRARFGYLLFLKQSGAGETQIAELDGQIFVQMTNLGSVCYDGYLRKEPLSGELAEMCSFIYSLDEQIKRFEESAKELQNAAPVFAAPDTAPVFNTPVQQPDVNESALPKQEIQNAPAFVAQPVEQPEAAVQPAPVVQEQTVPPVQTAPFAVEFAPPVNAVPSAVEFVPTVQPQPAAVETAPIMQAFPAVQQEYGATAPLASQQAQDDGHIESIRIESVERCIVKKCTCGHENDASSLFCENCGSRLG